MNRRRFMLAATIMCAVVGGGPCYSEALVPKTVQFEPEVKDDAYAKACHIVLLLLNIPAPETINFHFLITRPKRDGRLVDPVFIGFQIDVGELTFSNGAPSGVTKVNLSTAAFDSSDFSSVGRLNSGSFADGGLLATTADTATGNEFMKAFLKGQYELSFTRMGLSGVRTYKISASPPVDVVKQFQACLNTL
jgi:hypothetical protein